MMQTLNEKSETVTAQVPVKYRRSLVAVSNALPQTRQAQAYNNLWVAAVNASKWHGLDINDHPDHDTGSKHPTIQFNMQTPIGPVAVTLSDIWLGETRVEVSQQSGLKRDRIIAVAWFQRGADPFLQDHGDRRKKCWHLFELPTKFVEPLAAWTQTPRGFHRLGPVLM